MMLKPRLVPAIAAALMSLWAAAAVPLLVSPVALVAVVAEAQARSGGSGGYSRPAVRTPPPSRATSSQMGASRSDMALSRRGSAEALQRYRAGNAPPSWQETRRPSTLPPGEPTLGGRRGWVPPPYAAQSPNLGGVGNAVLLWFLLDTLARPGHAEYFHSHQDDPAYQSWRQSAEQRAQDDPEVRAKLAALDNELARQADRPRDPSYRPPDLPKQGGGSGFTLLAVAVLGAGLVLMWRARRKMKTSPNGSALDLAARMARGKLGGEAARESPYRVGMTLNLDPTPFVLAGNGIKVRPPAGGLTSVTAIGRLASGAITLDRLYLPQDQGFFQLADGGGECRFFTMIDQVVPADEGEWAFWLDRAEGLIGWPTFDTKDGKTYDRVWQPGGQRVEPPRFDERLTALEGNTARQLTAMLYAAPTGLPPPAPETEYVLVSAVEAAGQAWIEVAAGIDVNPASLSLPSRR